MQPGGNLGEVIIDFDITEIGIVYFSERKLIETLKIVSTGVQKARNGGKRRRKKASIFASRPLGLFNILSDKSGHHHPCIGSHSTTEISR